jgi:nucleotide-binding universal stress UspA family protein
MYKKILVPLDGSERAEAILPYVEKLAQSYQAKVLLLRVLEAEPFLLGSPATYYQFDLKRYQWRAEEAESYLGDLCAKLRQKGIEASMQIIDGAPVAEILNAAVREEVDLIAMASHGRTGLDRAIYGSVAAGILHGIDRPLLIIRSTND